MSVDEKTIAVVGVRDEEAAHLRLLMRRAAAELSHAWKWGGETNADLLVVDPSSFSGQMARTRAQSGGMRCAIFSDDPEVRALVAHMSDADIDGLKRGGHDFRKLFAAFAAAKDTKGRPTVILAKTKKGYGMGGAGESRMTSHQAKKLDIDALYAFRDRFALPLTNRQVENLEFFKPARIDEVLEVTTRVKETTAATLVLDQRIGRGGRELFTAEVTVVLLSRSGKPLRLSAALREALT